MDWSSRGCDASSRRHGICIVLRGKLCSLSESWIPRSEKDSEKSVTGTFKKKIKVATEERKVQTQRRFLIGCQIALVKNKNFRINGESEAIFDFGDLMKVELANDNLQSLDT